MSSWRSKSLPWIAVGAIVGAGALLRFGGGDEQQRAEKQNVYASRAACEQDYRAEQCARTGGYYYGPRYIPGSAGADDPGPGRTAAGGSSRSALSVADAPPAARGGFGETARGGAGGYSSHYGGG